MDATALAEEAIGYLEAIDLFHSLDQHVEWRTEAEEIGPLAAAHPARRPHSCRRCGLPLMRINGQHICLRLYSSPST
jgi:hypothetical protein